MPNGGSEVPRSPYGLQADYRMIWIIAAFSLLLMTVDRAVVRRRMAASALRMRRAVTAAAWAADLLPFLFSGVTFAVYRDNPTAVTMASMWVFFAYMVLAVARLPLNLCLLASKRVWVHAAGGVLSAAAAAAFVYGMAVTRTDYVINRIEIVSDRLPASFDGYKIVQLSDLHVGTMLRPQRETERIVELCNGTDADMAVFCGDLINIRHSEIGPVAPALSRLRAADGVYSVTGNHDLGVYVRDTISLPIEENTRRVIAAETALGWRVLDNETVYVCRGGDSVSLTGLSFDRVWAERRHSPDLPASKIAGAYDGVPQSLFNVTLSHIPQLWDDIVSEGYGDLTLAGHVHAMQMKLRVGGRGVSPAAIRYSRWSGLYAEHGRNLYINDGIGCVLFPMRVGARPEITVFVLRSGGNGV